VFPLATSRWAPWREHGSTWVATSADKPTLASFTNQPDRRFPSRSMYWSRPASTERVWPAAITASACSSERAIPSVRGRSPPLPSGSRPKATSTARPDSSTPAATSEKVPSPPAEMIVRTPRSAAARASSVASSGALVATTSGPPSARETRGASEAHSRPVRPLRLFGLTMTSTAPRRYSSAGPGTRRAASLARRRCGALRLPDIRHDRSGRAGFRDPAPEIKRPRDGRVPLRPPGDRPPEPDVRVARCPARD